MEIQNSTSAIGKYWDFLFIDLADPRTNDWPLIKSPVPPMTIIGIYLYFVNFWGPRFMKDRKPYQFKNTLIVYNFLQVLVSVYLFVEGMNGGWLRHYSWRCQPVDTSDFGIREARGCYVYFIAKLTELLDTIFFVLRKKDNQVSFLHLYHHTVMPMISWGCTKYYPGGHGTFIGVINSFVHIVMYFYYMLAAMGPEFQKYLWWKHWITNLQMIQFGMAFLHSAQLLYTDCGYPRWSVCFTLPNAIFFYMLFNDFYKKSYTKKGRAAAAAKTANGKIQNGKANGHITHDLNHNEMDTKPSENKKEN